MDRPLGSGKFLPQSAFCALLDDNIYPKVLNLFWIMRPNYYVGCVIQKRIVENSKKIWSWARGFFIFFLNFWSFWWFFKVERAESHLLQFDFFWFIFRLYSWKKTKIEFTVCLYFWTLTQSNKFFKGSIFLTILQKNTAVCKKKVNTYM